MIRPFVRDTRHVSLARVLHARLYVNGEGRIFSVSGCVAHDKLKQTLARHGEPATAAKTPTPRDLGIATYDGELSQHLLHCIGRALNRWRKEIAAEMSRKPAKRRSSKTLAREYQEIERLTSRLRELRQWQAELAGEREPPGSPFFLDRVAEASLRVALESAQCQHPLPRLTAWQARVVYWLSGDCATRRFLAAVTALAVAYRKTSFRGQISGFQQAVIVWKKRSQQERIANLLAEMGTHLQQLPSEVVRKGKLSRRLRGRGFQEHCDLLIRRCSHLLLETERQRWQVVPGALAALAAADGSATPIPLRCFQTAVETECYPALLWTVQKLADEIGQSGYDSLLAAVNEVPELPYSDFTSLRQLLAKGNSLADSAWACKHELAHDLARSCLRVSAVRHLSETFAQRGWPLSDDDMASLVQRLRRKEDVKPVQAWLTWLGSVSPRAVTARLQKGLSATFWNRYLPSVLEHDWFEQLAPCLAAARRSKADEDLQPLLDRIAVYQDLSGKREPLPKSLRKLLDSRERRQGEHEALLVRQAAGDLDRAAQTRLRWLERNPGTAPNAVKIRRTAEEAFLTSGNESLSVLTHKLAKVKCQTYLGRLTALIEPHWYWAFGLWINAMSEAERDCLGELVLAHEIHGRNYKRRLRENRDWVATARLRGVDLDRWFAAKPETIVIGGRVLDVTLADDPRHIFLMGAYFRTCLSPGQCNEMSVLANAYDANKQVVFVFSQDRAGRRQVFARQLIAVSGNFKLLGYRCYMDMFLTDKENRLEIETALAAYCGRLAAQCGLELADCGSPDSIGDHFWYDDGECQWPAAARTAWVETSRTTEAMALSPY